jgi:hypothetical protein
MRKLLFNYSFYSHPEIGNFRLWQGATLRSIEMCTEMAQRVDCIRTSQPLMLSNLPFQIGIRLATLSTSGCIVTLGSLHGERGTPRYVHWKEATAQPSNSEIRSVCCASQRMGNAWVLT